MNKPELQISATGQPDSAPAKRAPVFSLSNPQLPAWRWAVIITVEFAATVLLLTIPIRTVGVAIFTFVPLAALIWLAPDMLRAVLRRPKLRDILVGIGFGVLALAVSTVVALVLFQFITFTDNPIDSRLASQTLGQNLYTLFLALIQLFGEELLTLVALMSVYQLCRRHLKSEAACAVIAWVASSAIFGLVHLKTYGFNLVQALVVIGIVRMVLTLGFLLTKNLYTSYTSHLIQDNTIFISTIIGTLF